MTLMVLAKLKRLMSKCYSFYKKVRRGGMREHTRVITAIVAVYASIWNDMVL